jgi:hypothetical protein
MKSTLLKYDQNQWHIDNGHEESTFEKYQLVLCFGAKDTFSKVNPSAELKALFKNAAITFCSTAGEIYQEAVLDNSLIAVALKFESTEIKTAEVNIIDFNNSYDAAHALIGQLPKQGLRYVMVFSDGSLVNGSELVKGINEAAGDILVMPNAKKHPANNEQTDKTYDRKPTLRKIKRGASQRTKPTLLHHI